MTTDGQIVTVFHEYTDGDEHSIDPWWAVRIPRGEWIYKGETSPFETIKPFVISPGEPVTIYSRHDIDGLRKLLDAIEARF